jgi:hypothetical protein
MSCVSTVVEEDNTAKNLSVLSSTCALHLLTKAYFNERIAISHTSVQGNPTSGAGSAAPHGGLPCLSSFGIWGNDDRIMTDGNCI